MRERGVYHVHVMKTGGTSLTRMFHAHFGHDRSYPTALDVKERRQQKFAAKLLLAMAPEERAGFAFVSTHMGAWVADEFPDHLTVTVLRDPVDRTISHLRQLAELPQTPDDLEAIYEDAVFHPRLVDHQTQVFAARREDYLAGMAEQDAYDPSRFTGPERAAIRDLLWGAFSTTIGATRVIDEHSYAEAVARLDRIDEVGVTERLDALVARVGRRIGCEFPEPRRDNVGSGASALPAGLRDRIEGDMAWDRRLYEHALARQPR